MASLQGPLRRWKRFLPAFASTDAAIEDAGQGVSRVEFREARFRILEILCDTTDDAVAEKLCAVLDEAMIESLLTLKLVPATATMLSSTDLAKDIGALTAHESGRVRGLATDVVRGWKTSVKAELDNAAAAMEKLSKVLRPDEPDHRAKIPEPSVPEKKIAPPVFPGSRVKTARMERLPPPPPRPEKVSASVVGCSRHETSINTAKRKHREREAYQEEKGAKRQRTVHVMEAPAMEKQKQRERHPILEQRSRSNCPTSSTSKRGSYP